MSQFFSLQEMPQQVAVAAAAIVLCHAPALGNKYVQAGGEGLKL